MSQTLDLGRRVELMSMDRHCSDISIGLYQDERRGAPAYRVHTYSRKPEAAARIAFITDAMQVLGGMERTEDGLLRFPCGHAHLADAKRELLESAQLKSDADLGVHPLRFFDEKGGVTIVTANLGDGTYHVAGEGEVAGGETRLTTIARGLMRLGQLEEVEGSTTKMRFPCGQSHDALVGLLLLRAPNVRAALREAEEMASRGVLAAPSGNQE
jgi:hypothetical protein